MSDSASPEGSNGSRHTALSSATDFREPGYIVRAGQRVGLFGNRNMFWFKSDSVPCNFGDWVGPLLFEAISGDRPYWCHIGRIKVSGTVFFTAGSIMGQITRADRAVVWGSGIIQRNDAFEKPRAIHAVRGPLSRARCLDLGYDCPDVYGDPAILLPRFLPGRAGNPQYKLGIIPHHVNMEESRRRLSTSSEVLLIDVMRPVQDVCRDICNCSCTVSSSLHGVIVSHAFNIPSAWITMDTSLHGDNVKFHDYHFSLGIDDLTPYAVGAGEFDIESLVTAARGAPLPDVSSLHDGLLKSCPF